MNADGVLVHYERLADGPDAIPRLRRFILDLAVRGKLVEQDPSDEPVAELLERIATKKVRLAKASKFKKRTSIPPDRRFEEGSPIPTTWTSVRLVEISNIVMGQSPPGLTYNTDGYGVPLINGPLEFSEGPFGKTVRNQYTTAPTNSCNKGDFLICVRGSTTGRSNIAAFNACIGRGVAAIQPLFEDRFVRLFLWSMRERIIGMGRGIAFPSITRKQLEDLPIPLPPFAEQHRIVVKGDELMALCDQLEAARAERETTRNRLAAASLARLNAPDPDPTTFQRHATFTLDNLTHLTTRSDQINALRQTILSLAVRGKIVAQNSTDEPASRLLERLVESKGPSRRRTENISEPYGLPATWTWAALDKLITIGPQNGVSPKPTTQTDAPMAITLTATTSGTFRPNNYKHVEAKISEDSELWLRNGDLLFQRGNTREYVGIAAIYEGPSRTFVFPDLMMRVRVSPLVNLRFVHLAAISPPARAYFSENASGAQATMPKINQTILVSLPIPLPPLAEQHRIVAKVDELMAICARLEESLATGDYARRRLLETVLHNSLVPNTEPEAAGGQLDYRPQHRRVRRH